MDFDWDGEWVESDPVLDALAALDRLNDVFGAYTGGAEGDARAREVAGDPPTVQIGRQK